MDPDLDPAVAPVAYCDRCRAIGKGIGVYLNGLKEGDGPCPLCPLRAQWRAEPAAVEDWSEATWQQHFDRFAAVRWPDGLPEHWSVADQRWEFNRWLRAT